eukprot:scaffold202_cov64-Cylindrotheca_fusiformis.AAC.2
MMYDIPLGNSSNPDNERITETSSEISRSSTSDRAEEGHSQKAFHDNDDNDDIVISETETAASLSERTTATASECPICLEQYRPENAFPNGYRNTIYVHSAVWIS